MNFCSLTLLSVSILLMLSNAAGASPSLTKELVLQDLAENVLAPGYADVAAKCKALAEAAKQLKEQPDAATLEKARQAWAAAALSAQRFECFRIGPVVDGGYSPLFYFWPTRPPSIERVIKGSEPLTEETLEELGAAVKGLYALEYLLYQPDAASTLATLTGPSNERRRLFIYLLSQELAVKSEQLAKEWQAPMSQSARNFVEGSQASINLVVNQLARNTEVFNQLRLLPLLDPVPETIKGAPSGLTTKLCIASCDGARLIYAGGAKYGLDDYLRSLKLPVADRLDEQFKKSINALVAMDGPLSSLLENDAAKLKAAYESCHELEVVMKLDLTSALGVTLTFSPIDGD